MRKKGSNGRKSAGRIRSRFHQMRIASTTGSEQVTLLESRAQIKKSKERTNQLPRRGRSRLSKFSKLRYARTLSRKNAVERRFLISVTHATDSTMTGCRAKTAAANQEPRRPSFRRTSQNRTAFSVCNATFTA